VLERGGLGPVRSRAEMEALGFYVCTADLEDELIRAAGAAAVERIISDQGELGSFRTFQQQPAQRRQTAGQQLHRFLGTRSGRKSQYAPAGRGARTRPGAPPARPRAHSRLTRQHHRRHRG
jgi:hypothetical protein